MLSACTTCPDRFNAKGAWNDSLSVFDHDVWYLDILFCLIFCCDLKDDVLLVAWDRLFADRFKQFTHPKRRQYQNHAMLMYDLP
jgi:hypothetical protein